MSTDDPTQQLPLGTSPVDISKRPAPSAPPVDAPEDTLILPAARTEPSRPADRPAPDRTAAEPANGTRHRLRVGTVVWGLVIAAIGVGILAVAAGAEIDVQLAVIVLLAAAGVAMLVGSILGGVRRQRP